MTQYIPKSALVAEIERRIKVLRNNPYENHKTICHLDSLKQSLNTHEVKEVDLELELANYNREYVDENGFFNTEHLAKHFFELGMCAANQLTVKDIKKIYHLVNEVSDDLGVRAMYVNIYQEALKRFKAQKREQ